MNTLAIKSFRCVFHLKFLQIVVHNIVPPLVASTIHNLIVVRLHYNLLAILESMKLGALESTMMKNGCN
jgi:hypothetical protein